MGEKKVTRWTSVLMLALIGFLSGLGLARLQLLHDPTWLWLVIVTLTVSLMARRRDKRPFYIMFIIFACTLGWWRGSVTMDQLAVYQQYFGREVTLQATALEDAVYNEAGQLTFTADTVAVSNPASSTLIGQVEISGFGANAVYRGDRIEVQGLLFPKRGANQAGMRFAQMTIIARGNSPIDTLRRNFAAGMQNALPEPLASFALGLLIGQRNTLGEQLTDALTYSGLIHIVAVSGYNLTVIIHASQRLFDRRSRYQTLVFSLLLIGLFLLMTGNSPSIVRAALVSVLGLGLWYFGRRPRPVLLLLLAAAITAGANPLYLWSNIGWYLSFTAFFGVLVVAPLLQARLLKPSLRGKLLPTIFTETTAAQLCTLPIILFIFGRLSVVSIAANLLVVPAVPLAMLFSLFAGVSGMIGWWFTGLVALPAKIVLEYMLSIANMFANIPHANIALQISAPQMVYLYIVLLGIVLTMQRKLAARRVTIPPEYKE